MASKSERTKQALGGALVELLREMPLAKVTVRGITQRAGVDRQTFYYHFETLSDLVTYVCRMQLSTLIGAAGASRDMHELFYLVISEVDARRDVLVPLMNNVGRPVLRELFYDAIYSVFTKQAMVTLEALGVCVPPERLEFAVQYCQFASVMFVIDWLEGKLAASPERLADSLYEAFEQQMRGLASAYSGR